MVGHCPSSYVPTGRAACVANPSYGVTAQQRVVLGPLVFSSEFDSGNMGGVKRVPLPSALRSDSAGGPKEEYAITIAPDCCGTVFENGYRTWFYFSVALADPAEVAATSAAKMQSQQTGGLQSNLSSSSILPLATSMSLDDIDVASASAEGDGEDDFVTGMETVDAMMDDEVSHNPPCALAPRCPSFPSDIGKHGDQSDKGMVIRLAVHNMNNQGKLYKQGFRPWYRNLPHEPRWRRLTDTAETAFSYEWGGEPAEGGTGLSLHWKHRFFRNGGTSYFAFCVPFGYAETQEMLATLDTTFGHNPLQQHTEMGVLRASALIHARDNQMDVEDPDPESLMDVDETCQPSCKNPPGIPHMHRKLSKAVVGREDQLKCLSDAIQEDWVPKAGQGIYFFRQELHRSLENRMVDLITITAQRDVMMDASSDGSPLLDEPPQELPLQGKLPRLFSDRPIVFISCRVHPGESPAQFTFWGTLRFLLSDDPRAEKLRNQFTFKLVPILNPDGVANGHYRTNMRGQNLNRYYDNATREEQEGVWAVKQMLIHWTHQQRLLMYVDLHGHATKRGCFVLANRLTGMGQAWNMGFARLMQVNSPHFDLDGCDFADSTAASEKGKDGLGKEGSGRVTIYQSCKLCHAYTLECNYYSGRFSRPVAPASGFHPSQESPSTRVTTEALIPYTPAIWAQVGEAVCVSVLDLYGHNCHSRLPGTKYGSVNRLLSSCPSLRARASQSRRGGADIMPQFSGGVTLAAVSEREKGCQQSHCCWKVKERGHSEHKTSFGYRDAHHHVSARGKGSARSNAAAHPSVPSASCSSSASAAIAGGSVPGAAGRCSGAKTTDAGRPVRPVSQQTRTSRRSPHTEANRATVVRPSAHDKASATTSHPTNMVRRRSHSDSSGNKSGPNPRRRNVSPKMVRGKS